MIEKKSKAPQRIEIKFLLALKCNKMIFSRILLFAILSICIQNRQKLFYFQRFDENNKEVDNTYLEVEVEKLISFLIKNF